MNRYHLLSSLHFNYFLRDVIKNRNLHCLSYMYAHFMLHHISHYLNSRWNNWSCILIHNLQDHTHNVICFTGCLTIQDPQPSPLDNFMLINLTNSRWIVQYLLVQRCQEMSRSCNLESFIPNHKYHHLERCFVIPYCKSHLSNDNFSCLYMCITRKR